MPKAIEIYVEALTGTLMLDANTPTRELIFRFGWDDPGVIWPMMNDTVPGIICSRIRLVRQNGMHERRKQHRRIDYGSA